MANIAETSIFLEDLLEAQSVDDNDILVIEDSDNTKKIKFKNLRKSLISDEEEPTDYRIYSAKKITELIKPIKDAFDNDLGKLGTNIDNLAKSMATQESLKEAINKIDKKKLDVTGLDPVIEELQNTRKTTDKISSSDLATGTDADKIHLKNLGTDVMEAMAGDTPITLPSVPKGGWVSEDLANGSITSAKLAKDYTFRGSTIDKDLNRIVESGLYVVASSAPGCPHYGDDMGESRLLEVIRYGDGGKYIIQRVYYHEYIGEQRPYFERKGLFAQLATLEFDPHFEITEFNKVESPLLGDRYNNRGSVSSGSVFDIVVNGNHLCLSTVKDLPTKDNYLVTINTYDTRKEYIAKCLTTYGTEIYTCYEYNNTAGLPVRTDWVCQTDITKSKFDGKLLYVFGDGIIRGSELESSDTIPTILSSKYGWDVHDKSTTDGTIGGYGNDDLEENCVLAQINGTPNLTTNDDIYVLIFAGSEDYRFGLANIGNDTDMSQSTFKGALNLAIDKILARAPYAKILLVNPIYRASTKPNDGFDGDSNLVNNNSLRDFAVAIQDVAKYNHVPCLDLYNECMINKYNCNDYLINGVYLNERGSALIAEKIQDGLSRFY